METSGKVRQSQPFWLKFWMFFRWMFLAIAVAAVLFSLAFFVFTGIWQWIFGGAAFVIMFSIGLWGHALGGEVYRRSAPMNVPFVGKEEEPALASWTGAPGTPGGPALPQQPGSARPVIPAQPPVGSRR